MPKRFVDLSHVIQDGLVTYPGSSTSGGSRCPRGFRFFAVPVKVAGLGSFPVRAFARLDRPE